MFDLLTQFPIQNQGFSMVDLQQEAIEQTRAMAVTHGYALAGPPSFEVLDLPLSMYLQCRVPVEELQFGGGRR